VVTLGGSENATRRAEAFSSQVATLGGSENATRRAEAFSSQVATLGGSENATRQTIIIQAKWLHLAAQKKRSE
jgi:hypothetical protein